MRKRQKFVLTAAILSVGLWLIQATGLEWRYVLIMSLSALTWLLAAWSLKEGLNGIEWLTVLLPLVLFTAGVGLFYILLPTHWLARLVVLLLFGIGQYALLLSANIFSVAAIRTIALARAAQAVSALMTLATGFFLFNTILSLRLGLWVVGGGVSVTAGLLLLPALWQVRLSETLSKDIWKYSLLSAFSLGVLSIALTFWPFNLSVTALLLTAMLYVYMGVFQHQLMERLFKNTTWEYVIVATAVLITTFITLLLPI